MPDYMIQTIYLIGTLMFIYGVKQASTSAKFNSSLTWVGISILIMTVATFFHPQVLSNVFWITVALITGSAISFFTARNASIENIPKLIALYNGLAGGAAAAIATAELTKLGINSDVPQTDFIKYMTVAGALIGCISFNGSMLCFLKLHGLMKPMQFPMHQWLNALLLVVAITFGLSIILNGHHFEMIHLILFIVLALGVGKFLVLPIANSDMPIVISFLMILSGLAVGIGGYTQGIPVMIIAGALVASSATVLASKITKTKNRSIFDVLLGNKALSSKTKPLTIENLKEVNSSDAAIQLAFAKNVVLIPGYGLAASQAQTKLSELNKQLVNKGVNVKFAIHPAAGRIPGHMNLLLADVGVDHDDIYDLTEINDEFTNTDIVLIIGGNDITNPSARTDKQSPVFGMSILNADQAKQVIVIKRGDGVGFSNIENPLFYKENTNMLYGDAQSVLSKLVSEIKTI